MGSEWTWRIQQNTPYIVVPESLLSYYRKRVGVDGVIIWMYLQLLGQKSQRDSEVDVMQWLQGELEWEPLRIQEGFCLLVENGLVRVEDGVCMVLMPRGAADEVGALEDSGFFIPEANVQESFPSGHTDRTTAAKRDVIAADIAAVTDLYEKRMGALSPMQRAKLKFWIQVKGMAADVVAYAIDYVTKNDELASIHSLEQQLRKWYIAGVRDIDGLRQYLESKEF